MKKPILSINDLTSQVSNNPLVNRMIQLTLDFFSKEDTSLKGLLNTCYKNNTSPVDTCVICLEHGHSINARDVKRYFNYKFAYGELPAGIEIKHERDK